MYKSGALCITCFVTYWLGSMVRVKINIFLNGGRKGKL
jgi:hypothetical protein